VKVLDPATGTLFALVENLVDVDLNILDPGDFPPGSGTGRSEMAGAVFSADGRWLFVSVQIPGATYAITGPWADLGI